MYIVCGFHSMLLKKGGDGCASPFFFRERVVTRIKLTSKKGRLVHQNYKTSIILRASLFLSGFIFLNRLKHSVSRAEDVFSICSDNK